MAASSTPDCLMSQLHNKTIFCQESDTIHLLHSSYLDLKYTHYDISRRRSCNNEWIKDSCGLKLHV
jgi:hypothetical protein